MSNLETASAMTRVWEWPLRAWHWLFAFTIAGSLITGLSGEIAWMDWHLRFGFVSCGLLVFRLVWGFVGGIYSRWSTYKATPRSILAYFRSAGEAPSTTIPGDSSDAHTAPGVLLIWMMLLLVLAQTVTGLFTTDDIFIEGPLVRHVDSGLVSDMTWLHHRVFMGVMAAIGMHLLAHIIYGLKRDPLPLAMFTGRKQVPSSLSDTPSFAIRGMMLGLISALVVWAGLALA